MPMSTRRFFLGWDQPLVELANNFLKKNLSKKLADKTLIVVPSKQAARKLKNRYKENSKSENYPIFGTPETALKLFENDSQRPPTQTEKSLTWALTLKNIKLKQLKNIFPITPPDRSMNWALRTSNAFIGLKNSLSEGGLNISDVNKIEDPNFKDLSRWQELELLESIVESSLKEKGLSHLSQHFLDSHSTLDDIEQIILIGLPDPPKVLIDTLQSISKTHKISIVIYAPDSEQSTFSEWGIPIAEHWSNHKINIKNAENSIRHVSDPDQQSREVVSIISEHSDPFGMVAIINNDIELIQSLKSELKKQNINAFDPSGGQCSSQEIYATLALFRELISSGSFESAVELLNHPEIINYIVVNNEEIKTASNNQMDLFNEEKDIKKNLNDPKFAVADILANLDRIKNKHIPTGLDMALKFSADNKELKLTNLALKQLNEWRDELQQDLIKSLPDILESIYSDREFDSEKDQEFYHTAEFLKSILKEIHTSPLHLMDKCEQLDFILNSLKNQSIPEKRAQNSLDIQGWLEVLWEDRPHLIMAGMNEGSIPNRIASDIFLPDSMRSKLGLRNNETVLARDNYIFNAALNWRNSGGRVDLILGKESLEGTPLKPSRLLFQCDDIELPDRALSLCSRINSSEIIHPWTSSWKLKPMRIDKDAKIFREISVTQFSNYLSCPFRFYLQNLMGMNDNQPTEMEMDPRQFGTLFHQVLDDFGGNEEIRDSHDESEIYKFLEKRIESRSFAKFGRKLTVPLSFQINSIKERLKWFSSIQANERSLGWRIHHSEFKIHTKGKIKIGKLKLKGTIDRIEQNENDGTWRILDYKTSESPKKPKEAHLQRINQSKLDSIPDWAINEFDDKSCKWTNLQIPLYVHSAKSILREETICTGYFNLSNTQESVKIEIWEDFGDDFLESAVNCAEGISESISECNFWPPTDSPKYDNYSGIIFGDCDSSFDPSEILKR